MPDEKLRQPPDGMTILGKTPEDPDFLPITPPSGFIWMLPGHWSGGNKWHPIVDCRVSVDGEKLDFTMSMDDLLNLRDFVQRAIERLDDGKGETP